ncbi:MAG: hypothetical protein U0791_04135 [Gemmataceae bacterium]
MLRIILLASALLAFTTMANAAPAPAAGVNVALPYPAKAPLVLHIHGVERSRERLAKMLEALPQAEAKQIKKGLEDGLTQLLKDRKLDAVVPDGRTFLVVNDIAKLVDEEPAVSLLIPVTSYKGFKDSLLTATERKSVEKAGNGFESFKFSAGGEDRTFYLVDVKGYAVVTPNKDTAEVYAGKYTPAQSGAMGPDLSGSFLNADVSLFVNMDVINDLYGDQIRQGRQFMDFALGQAQNMGMIPGLGKQQLDMAKAMIGGVFQVVEDSKGIVLALEFRPEGLNVRGQVRFADDTTSADVLKMETPTALADLSKLPKGLSTYGGSKLGKKFTDLGAKFSQEFLAGEDDEKGAERIAKLQAEILAAGPAGSYSASKSPDRGLTVTTYKDPQRALDSLAKLYAGLGEGGKFSTIALKSKPVVTPKAGTHRDIDFTEVKLSFDFAAAVEALPEPAREPALNQFKRLMNEKTTYWYGTDGKALIQITAKDWAAAKQLLDEYLDSKAAVGGDAGFQVVRKNLPQEASLLYLLETGDVVMALVEQVKSVAQAIPGGGLPPVGGVKPVKGDASYLGFALTLKPQVATGDMFIPGGAMNVAVKMLAPLFRNVE